MLGTDEEALDFIQEFSRRRFSNNNNKKPTTTAKATTTVGSSSSSQQQQHEPQQKEKDQQFPSLPAEQNRQTEWPANINVYMKKDTQGDYYSGTSKKNKGKSNSSSTTTNETAPKKKKKNEMTLEAALKELHIKASTAESATKHPLLTIAPNCLNCGKIICTVEGTGPCTFCDTPVLSKEQQVALIAEAKKKRVEDKQRLNAQQQSSKKRSKQIGSTPSVGYAAKVSGQIVPTNAYQEPNFDYDQEEQNRQKAEAHKEKLLEFQRTSAKRTTVIDQATDFTLPSDQLNPWLTPQERALEMKKKQSNMKRLMRTTGDSSRRRVISIDVSTRQVMMDDAESSSSDSEPEELRVRKEQPQEEDGSARTYANNPLLKGIQAPKFVGKHKPLSGGRNRRKDRVQYDDDDMMDDFQFMSSMADDRDVELEPACG
ncbi:putative zinc finger motif, C2HC5-type-domain-containing protein [Phascolomyces articulosus]|uniref:Zinc finger motif, C2HC5-type-domain-containing protein n=1 Tax=Phascolomyces articulosus TaxID=60185 RepID=A0AAD5KBT8_9FUNG|nr:putative zinc finger motif, C2HC5-type-domain-containing protein [Phascolomyces articulosus]